MFKIRGEAEPVDEDTQWQITEEARRRFQADRADQLARRDAVSRSVRLRKFAERGPQASHRRQGRELGAIDAQLEILGRKAAQRRAMLSAAP